MIKGAGTRPDGHIAKAKKAIRCVIGVAQVFAGAEEKEKAKNKNFGGGKGRRGSFLLSESDNLREQGLRQWFYARGG